MLLRGILAASTKRRTASTEARLAFAVLTVERNAAEVSAPHSQRNPLVTLRKITLGRRCRSETLLDSAHRDR